MLALACVGALFTGREFCRERLLRLTLGAATSGRPCSCGCRRPMCITPILIAPAVTAGIAAPILMYEHWRPLGLAARAGWLR